VIWKKYLLKRNEVLQQSENLTGLISQDYLSKAYKKLSSVHKQTLMGIRTFQKNPGRGNLTLD